MAGPRRQAIRRELEMHGAVRTAELAARWGLSGRTVQRDLEWIAGEVAAARRVYGGLVLAEEPRSLPALRIGMLLPARNHYYAAVIAGVRRAAAALNVHLVTGTYGYREDQESLALQRMGELDLDGLVATVGHDGTGYEQLRRLEVATVVVERPSHPERLTPASFTADDQIDHVCTDHEAGAVIGLRHLAGLSHRRILCLVRETATSESLVRGLSRAGVPGVEILRLPVEAQTLEPQPGQRRALLDEVVQRCRPGAAGDRATAVFVHADWEAIGVYESLVEAGIDVPRQVSVLSYDGVAAGLEPVLSAVTPRRHWIGTMALETVVDRLRSRGRRSHAERPGYQLSLLPELVLRSSTGQAA